MVPWLDLLSFNIQGLVRTERLELSRVAPLAPKASASTNSATFANRPLYLNLTQVGVNEDGRMLIQVVVIFYPGTRICNKDEEQQPAIADCATAGVWYKARNRNLKV
jgi:hypothetical protein